jgi:hypothetical protein
MRILKKFNSFKCTFIVYKMIWKSFFIKYKFDYKILISVLWKPIINTRLKTILITVYEWWASFKI